MNNVKFCEESKLDLEVSMLLATSAGAISIFFLEILFFIFLTSLSFYSQASFIICLYLNCSSLKVFKNQLVTLPTGTSFLEKQFQASLYDQQSHVLSRMTLPLDRH